MNNYNNFTTAAYFPATSIQYMTDEQVKEAISWYKRYMPLNKIYIETYRGGTLIEEDRLESLIKIFEKAGMETAGGITYTLPQEEYPWPRIMNSFCYSNEKTRSRVKEIAEYTARFFNELILDDFYFTDCSCEDCIRAKGERSWEEFRLALMTDVSQNLIIGPAKKINPSIKTVIKYPNWNESFPHVGYNTQTQPDLFDGIYTGTETRDTRYTQQHLPRYASYSLMRWMDDVSGGRNGGGWYDWIDCIYNLGSFLEQARLTALSGGRELTLFNFAALNDSLFIPPMGLDLQRVDKGLGHTGAPAGIPFYHPHHGRGDQHAYDYLGMAGFPLYPTPLFPEDPSEAPLLFCGGSSSDEDSVGRIRDYVRRGGAVVVTADLVRKTEGLGGILSHNYGTEKMLARGWSSHAQGCAYARTGQLYEEALVSRIDIHTNDSFPLAVYRDGEYNTPLIILDHYGKGDILTVNLPENPASLCLFPGDLLNAVRDILFKDTIRLQGPGDVSLFLYDNQTLALQSFRRENSRVSLAGIKELIPLEGAAGPDEQGEINLAPGSLGFYRFKE